ncbi:MAG TPA: hypothetical protein VD994_11330, partial [Prosthecobacter sp.]|nr:hypothetical protein [Prosthecobacter sp.]
MEIGEVHLASALTAAITVHLASSDTSELGVPASVTIPAGEIGATFPITIADDDFIDGTQTVTVTAAVTGWPLASSTMTVLDNESAELTLTVPQGALESAGVLVNAGVLRTSAPVENDLTVSLVSRNTGRITVPPVATIFARTSTAVFSLTLQNNTVLEGAQSVEIQASAPGFGTGTGIILIQDDEAPASPSNPSPAHGATSVHPDSDLAWQIDSGSGGQPSAYHVYFGLNPQPTAGDFIGTTSATTRTLPRLTAGTRYYWQIVTRKGTATRAGPVWSFTVAPVGSAKRLAWQALPTSVAVGAPFSARITAYDEFDNPATSFTGNASLTPLGGGPDTLTGSGATNWEMPLATFFKGARTQSIYKPGEVGAAGSLTSLALDVTVPPGQALNGFTIRLKHTNRNAYASGGQQGWESTGWTTVYQQNTTIAAAGWNWFVFTTPFQYDGVQNLMVDISFKNSFHTSYYGRCNATPMSENRSLYYFHDEQDPLAWGTTFPTVPLGSMSASLPNLRLRRTETPVSISPAVIGPFVDGAWSGDVALGAPGNVVRIQAQALVDPSVTGLSDAVDVVSVASLTLNSEPPFTGGSANTISWQPTGSGHEYEVQYSLTADFSSPISSGFVSTSGHTFSYLIDGRTYYYRGRVRTNGVAGVWSAPVHSTQDATPPTLQFTPASGGIVLGGTLTL